MLLPCLQPRRNTKYTVKNESENIQIFKKQRSDVAKDSESNETDEF